jgi:Tol biopolymer transport system component
MRDPFLRHALVILGIAALAACFPLARSANAGLPLQAARTLKFTTEEGTWMSVDISPDGRTLVFDLLGNLYTLPVTGGGAKQITHGFAYSVEPKFSPDGQKIAFISDGGGAWNLWMANVDGSNAVQLSKDDNSEFTSPAWLPDSQMILVSKKSMVPWSSFALWAYHIKGGAGVQLVEAAETSASNADQPDVSASQYVHTIDAVASPDGKQLYYVQRPGIFGSELFPPSQILRRNRGTGEVYPITDTLVGSAFRPELSPDGTKLAFAARFGPKTGLKILDLQTGEQRWLKYPIQPDDQINDLDGDILPGYAFTPDGKDIVIAYGGKIHRINVTSGQTELIPFTAKVSRGMGPLLDFPYRVDEGPVHWRILQGFTLSPDGKRLAVSAATHIYVMDVPGGTPHRLTKGTDHEYQPAWSPDGRWIAYVTWSTAGGQIWKIRSDGAGAPVKLTQVPAYYRRVVWSPDGSRIVTLRGPRYWQLGKPGEFSGGDELLDLVWISSQGGATHFIAPGIGVRAPHFVQDQPDRIYFYSAQGLTSMRLDGTDRRTYLNIKYRTWFEDPNLDYLFGRVEARMSPDGRWVVVSGPDQQLYLMPAPSFGKHLTVALNAISGTMPDARPLATAGDSILPVKKVTSMGADSFAWSQDGEALVWNLGATVFRQSLISLEEGRGKPEQIKVKLEFPRAAPHGTVLLRGARIITMRGDQVIEDGDILVKNNRIVNVGKRGSFAIPADTKTFDISGDTVVPGFIDVHDHLFEIRKYGVLDPDNNWDFLAALAYGVTTAFDPQPGTPDTFAYADLVDMGKELGPRFYTNGPGIFPYNNFQSLEQIKDVVTRYKQYYKTPYVMSYMIGNRRQRQWMEQACYDLKMMPTGEGALDQNLDLTRFIDGFNSGQHSLPVSPLFKDVVQLVAQSKVFITPTMKNTDYFFETSDAEHNPRVRRFMPYDFVEGLSERRYGWEAADELAFPRLAAQYKKIIHAGGRIAVGSHGTFPGLAFDWEMWAFASGGISNFEVLRSSTLVGAERLGLAQDLGSIEPGKLADLVVLTRDPLQDIRNTTSVRYVMKNGELLAADTLDEIWPVAKPLPPLWWWHDIPRGCSSFVSPITQPSTGLRKSPVDCM